MESEKHLASVTIDNEDESHRAFLKLLITTGILGTGNTALPHLRCKKLPVLPTTTNKFKKVNLEFTPMDGEYTYVHEGTEFQITLSRGQPMVLTECRQLEYEKKLVVSGPSI